MYIESNDHALHMADKINEICKKLKINWIYKSCYDKDCRSSLNSFHGVGLEKGLEILSNVRKKIAVPVISDFQILLGQKRQVKFVIWFKFPLIYVDKHQY